MSSTPEPNTSGRTRTDCRRAEQIESGLNLGVPRRKARPWFVGTAGLMVLIALGLWSPLQRKCTAYLLLQAEAPSEEVLLEATEHAADPAAFLGRLWRTQHLPHRQFVASYLSRNSSRRPDLFRELEPLVLEATRDPDVEVRQLAFATLQQTKHPQLRRLALEQLSDADPAVRLIGLQSLRSIATSNDVFLAVSFLKDPEPRVVAAAALVLRQATGQNFGIKSSDALPQFTCIGTNPPPAPDLQALLRGVRRGQGWWNQHQDQYQGFIPSSLPGGATISLPTPEFRLEDSAGKKVRLAQFLGRSILLVFWSPGAPASLDDAPALRTLQDRNSGRLAILGICLPAAPSCADELRPSPGQAREHAQPHRADCCGLQDVAQFRALAQQAAQRLKIRFPMLLDPESIVGPRFCASDLPLYVLIDAQGMVRRRFVGFRTEQALAAIIKEATDTRSKRNAGT